MKAILALSFCLAFGCASLSTTPSSPPDTNRMKEGHASPPSSSEELYDGFFEET